MIPPGRPRIVVASAPDADAATAHAAFNAGARAVTHLFNAQRPVHHRDPGITFAALARRDVVLGVIADGVHLDFDTVKVVVNAALERVALVTDAVAPAGLHDGEHTIGGQRLFVSGPEVRLEDGTIAGSVLTMDAAVRNLIDRGGAPFERAVGLRHPHPRRAGRPSRAGHPRPRNRRRRRRPRRFPVGGESPGGRRGGVPGLKPPNLSHPSPTLGVVKILHTADWHVGRSIRGRSRHGEQEEVLAEIARTAAAEGVDLVLVAGDLFDTSSPPPAAERLVYRTLLQLAEVAPVVIVAGNHDHPRRLEAVAPLLELGRVIVGAVLSRPDEGGVVRPIEGVRVAMIPFLSQRGIVTASDLMSQSAAEQGGKYADRMAAIIEAFCAGLSGDEVNIVVST